MFPTPLHDPTTRPSYIRLTIFYSFNWRAYSIHRYESSASPQPTKSLSYQHFQLKIIQLCGTNADARAIMEEISNSLIREGYTVIERTNNELTLASEMPVSPSCSPSEQLPTTHQPAHPTNPLFLALTSQRTEAVVSVVGHRLLELEAILDDEGGISIYLQPINGAVIIANEDPANGYWSHELIFKATQSPANEARS